MAPATDKYLFLDTSILIRTVERPAFIRLVNEYIVANGLTLAVGVMNLIEIYKWKKHWGPIADLISSVPFCYFKNPERIAEAEVRSYPDAIALPTAFCSREHSFTQQELRSAIEINMKGQISTFEENYRNYYRSVWQGVRSHKLNFPPEQPGKYTALDRQVFLLITVIQYLHPEHRAFLSARLAHDNSLDLECFRSVYIQMLAIFLEYYVQGKVGKPSDMADFLQISIVPYVELAVLDNERHDMIQRINRQGLFRGHLPSTNMAGFRKLVTAWASSTKT